MRITSTTEATWLFFLLNLTQIHDENDVERWKRKMRTTRWVLLFLAVLLTILLTGQQWLASLDALQHGAWLGSLGACTSASLFLSLVCAYFAFMLQISPMPDMVLILRFRLNDEQFAPFAAEQPVALTQEQLSLIPGHIGSLHSDFGRTVFSSHTTVTVDEQGMSWQRAGKRRSLMWHDISGFYCINYQDRYGKNCTTCLVNGSTTSFLWNITDTYSAAERIAYEQLSCLVVTRT